jgi:TRAP transporter TAXI family solute receptor
MKLRFGFTNIPPVLLYILGFFGIILALYALVGGLRLIPPDHLTIAAGSKGSAYYQISQRYQAILAEDNIRLEIVETAGSQDNRDLLDDPNSSLDIALIQGGITTTNDKLNALAAVFPEPLLVFARKEANLNGNPFSWIGKRVAFGAKGSGTREVIKQLATLTGAPLLESNTNQAQAKLGGKQASEALQQGKLDAAFFVAPLSAPYLQALYSDPTIQLVSLNHSQAIASQLPEAYYASLFSGAIHYQSPYPLETVPLVALVTKLVARDDLHPALVNRMMHAITKVHGKRVTLVMPAPFPNTSLLDMPVDVYASKLLREGFNPLEKTLPYWIVAQINRFVLLLLPMIFLLLPLFKILPALLAWRMQSRVYRYYDRLHEIDMLLSVNQQPPLNEHDRAKLAEELMVIEISLRSESLPLKYREIAYTAVQHLHLVRSRI